MADFVNELQQVIESNEFKDLLTTTDGTIDSTERQLKKGTLVIKEESNKKWLMYPNGYIRVMRLGADRLGVVYGPDGQHDYDRMGIEYYTKFAIPLVKENFLNLKKRDAKRWEKLSAKGSVIIEELFTNARILKVISFYFKGKVDLNTLFGWLNKLK